MAAELCLCGHRQGVHEGDDKGGYCNRCDCMDFEANTDVPVPEPVLPVVDPPKPKPKQTKIVAPPEPTRQRPPAANEVRYRDERAPEPEGKKVDGFPHKPEAGTWRALVEDLATGGIYLVARGSRKFVSETLRTHIEANPLPQTKRGVLSMDHDYVKARDDAPFFNAPLNGLVLP